MGFDQIWHKVSQARQYNPLTASNKRRKQKLKGVFQQHQKHAHHSQIVARQRLYIYQKMMKEHAKTQYSLAVERPN